MRKPWSKEEIARLLIVLSRSVSQYGFLVYPNDKGGIPPSAVQFDFKPDSLTKEEIKPKTIALCQFLRGVWRYPSDTLKQNGGFDPFHPEPEEEDAPAPRGAGARLRDAAAQEIARRNAARVAAAPRAPRPPDNPFRQAAVQYQAYAGVGLQGGAGIGGNGGEFVVNNQRWHQVAVDAPDPLGDGLLDAVAAPPDIEMPAAGRPARAAAAGEWPEGFLGPEKIKKETIRFKYEFTRSDGGIVYASIY